MVPRARLYLAVSRSDSTTPWLTVLATIWLLKVEESSSPRWKRVEPCHRTNSSLGPRPPKRILVCQKALLVTRLHVIVIRLPTCSCSHPASTAPKQHQWSGAGECLSPRWAVLRKNLLGAASAFGQPTRSGCIQDIATDVDVTITLANCHLHASSVSAPCMQCRQEQT